jgi:hypothetical protein
LVAVDAVGVRDALAKIGMDDRFVAAVPRLKRANKALMGDTK